MLAVAVMASSALATPNVGQAAVPGDLCLTDGAPTAVSSIWGNTMYILPPNSYFRIEDYGTSYGWPDDYRGHGTGRATGFLPRVAIVQSTCYQ